MNVLSGVSVGHGAVVAAGATVTRDIPDFAIAAGCPAKVLRHRFTPEVVAQMQELRWWDWEDERIARNRAFFELAIGPEQSIDLAAVVNP